MRKKHHRHIHARNDEYIHVHRGGGGGHDWLWKAALWVVGFFIAVEIIKAMAGYILLGLVGWAVLKILK